jgi:hypothetical protein
MAAEESLQRDCPKHGVTRFYVRSDGGFRCARCSADSVSRRRREVKRTLVKEAGGACVICGFDEHPAALQFHHLNPEAKDFNLSNKGLTKAITRMRAEARKCVLLCANCHALVGVGARVLPPLDR